MNVKDMRPAFFEEIKYGFKWGPVTVTRLISEEKKTGHYVLLEISTNKQELKIGITPTGLIRIWDIENIYDKKDG
jgi:hypothetical protein